MSSILLESPGRTLIEWVREIFRSERTGRLDISTPAGPQSLYFVGGALYLSPDHPVFGLARVWLDDSQGAPSGTGVLAARHLAHRLLDTVEGADPSQVGFVPGAGQIRVDLVGPLPTGQLLMENEVKSQDDRGLLRRLGGEEVVLQATRVGRPLPAGIVLDPQEAFLLSRLEHPARVGDLVAQLDLGRRAILERLCRLQAVELIARTDRSESAEQQEQQERRLLDRFLERIGESLERQPLDLAAERHREVLRDLMSKIGEMNHFELLAVSPESSNEDIHSGFFELGRVVHPSHAGRLGLTGKEGALEVLFERATQAYLTLSDPDRKVRYCRESGPFDLAGSSSASREHRIEEKRALARQSYQTALESMSRQDFHTAIQLLEQAVAVDPKADYFSSLAECQAENPQWFDRAAANLERAVQLRPDDPGLRSRLGRIYERVGRIHDAREAYRRALQADPELAEAKAGLARLGGGKPGARPKPSLASRLRALLGGGSGD